MRHDERPWWIRERDMRAHAKGQVVRRRLLTGSAAACAGLLAAPLRAQAARRCAVISLVGDQLELVYARVVTDTSLDRNRRRSVPDPQGTMDGYALTAIGRALDAEGGASAALLTVPPSPLHEQPERLFDDRSLALPGSLVDAIEQNRASHVVLLTKQRADASIPVVQGHLGVGKLRGLGYYIDTDMPLRIVETGATGSGLIAPYVYVKLTLADARNGAILNQRSCTAARIYALAARDAATDAWDVLKPEEKVQRLRDLLDRELARELPLLMRT
jgi:hypothetical protein